MLAHVVDLEAVELYDVPMRDLLEDSDLVADALKCPRVFLLYRHLLHCHHLSRVQVTALVHLAEPSLPWMTGIRFKKGVLQQFKCFNSKGCIKCRSLSHT